jgi:hypothetical protein
MYSTTETLDLRAFWIELSALSKLYAVYLAAVTIYTLFSLSRILVLLHFLKKREASEFDDYSYRPFALMLSKCENLHQLTFFSTLLFGLVFFSQFSAVFRGFGDSSETGWTVIFRGLGDYFAFDGGVLVVLTMLHTAEWIVSAHLRHLTLPH